MTRPNCDGPASGPEIRAEKRDRAAWQCVNRVGVERTLVGSLLPLLALLAAGCGARSDLLDVEAQSTSSTSTSAPTCAPASAEPSSRRFGDDQQQIASGIVLDQNGYPIVVGSITGKLDIDGKELSGPPCGEACTPSPSPPFGVPSALPPEIGLAGRLFVSRLAPAECLGFVRAFDPIDQRPSTMDVALDGEGAIILTASYRGAIDFGGGSLGIPEEGHSGAVVKLSPAGDLRWSRGYVATDYLELARPVVDAAGDVIVGGRFQGSLTLDGAPVASSTGGRIDGFVARLDPGGEVLWARVVRLGSEPAPAGRPTGRVSIAAWPSGDVAVSGELAQGSFAVPLDLGGGPIDDFAPQTGFVTVFDAAGDHRWAKLTSPLVTDSRVSETGTLVLLGGWDGYGFSVVRYDPDGKTEKLTSTAATAGTASLLLGPGGEAWVTGVHHPYWSNDNGIFLHVIDTHGELVSTRTWSSGVLDRYRAAVAVTPAGEPVLSGGFTGTIDMGTGAMTAGGFADLFVARGPQ